MSGIEIDPMRRAIMATTFGLLAGFLIGIFGPIIFVAASAMYMSSDFADEPYSAVVWSYLFAIGVIGALNGALGAWNGLRSDARSLWPVCLGPLLLLLYPFVEFIRNPNAGSMTWGGASGIL